MKIFLVTLPYGSRMYGRPKTIIPSFFDENVIMPRRDQGNFFGGRAMKMTELGNDVMDSGFGAYQGNENERDGVFYIKSLINYLDKIIMKFGVDMTPMKVTDVKSDDPGFRDLQQEGYRRFNGK